MNCKLDIEIGIADVIVGSGISEEMDLLISLIAYFIYKAWLKESLNDQNRSYYSALLTFKQNIVSKIHIYKSLSWEKYVQQLSRVIT